MLIRSASGLRGIAEDHFTPELIDNYISAFISTQSIKSCVIGRDGRPSGKQISQWVIDSFHKNGINVLPFSIKEIYFVMLLIMASFFN